MEPSVEPVKSVPYECKHKGIEKQSVSEWELSIPPCRTSHPDLLTVRTRQATEESKIQPRSRLLEGKKKTHNPGYKVWRLGDGNRMTRDLLGAGEIHRPTSSKYSNRAAVRAPISQCSVNSNTQHSLSICSATK